jgi:hypothetical protein
MALKHLSDHRSPVQLKGVVSFPVLKKKSIPSIFKDESTGSCIYLWKLAVAVATYVFHAR